MACTFHESHFSFFFFISPGFGGIEGMRGGSQRVCGLCCVQQYCNHGR